MVGCVGIVKVGQYKYKGLPCPNPEDAKQSAAAIAISNLPGAKVPLLPHPMYPPGPYSYPLMPYPPMFPPPPGGYPPGPPGQYYPPGHRPAAPLPSHTTRFNRPSSSFVPLQVQRRQVYKTAKDAELSKSAKPSASPTAQRENEKDKDIDKTKQKTLKQKLESLSLEDSEEVKRKPLVRVDTDGDKDPSSPTGTTFVMGHEPRNGPGTDFSADVGHSATERDQNSAEGQDGEDSDEDESKCQLVATEEKLLKKLEFMKHESEDARDKIKKLSSYMKAFETTPSEIHPEDEGTFPHQESQGNNSQGTSLMVSDIDPVAQAAIMASIQERERGDDFLEEGEVMEPMQPSETEPNVVVAGEIIQPQIHIQHIKSSHGEEVAVVTAVDHSPQSTIIQETKSTGDLEVDTMASTVTEHKPDPVVETKCPESDIQSTVATDESVESVPGTHHSLSKKPKRQLAASFMNN